MFNFKSLHYTTALSLTLMLSSIDSVSYAASSMEAKDPRIISELLKPSSILVAKKPKKKSKKLAKARKRERARINKAMRSTRAGVTANPTFAGKLQVIQDKESQISNTLSRLKKRLKSKRAKKKASLKNKTRRQIRFNKLLLKTTQQLRSEVQRQQAAELERQRVEAERQRLELERLAREAETSRREAERQRLERERLAREAHERNEREFQEHDRTARETEQQRLRERLREVQEQAAELERQRLEREEQERLAREAERQRLEREEQERLAQEEREREDRNRIVQLIGYDQSAHNWGDDVNKFSILSSLDRLNTRYSYVDFIDDNDLLQTVRDNLSAEFGSHPKLPYALLVIDALQGNLTGITASYPNQYRSFNYSETSGSTRSYSLLKILKLVWTGIIDDSPFGTSGPRQTDEDIKDRKANLLNILYDIRFGYGDNGNPASVGLNRKWSCPNGAATRLVGSLDGGAHEDVLIIQNNLIFTPFVTFMEQEFNRDPGAFQNVSETNAWNEMKQRLTRRAKEILFSDANSTRNLPNDVTQAIDERCRQEFTSLLNQEAHSVQESVRAVDGFSQAIFHTVEVLSLNYQEKIQEAVIRLTAKMKEYRFGDANSTRDLEPEIVNEIDRARENFFETMWF